MRLKLKIVASHKCNLKFKTDVFVAQMSWKLFAYR